MTSKEPQVPSPSGNQPASNISSPTGTQQGSTQTTTVTQQGSNPTTTPVPTGTQQSSTTSTATSTTPSGTPTIVIPNTTGPQPSDASKNAGTQPSSASKNAGTQPSGTQNTTGTLPNAPNPDPQGTNVNNSTPPSTPLTPQQLKDKRTEAMNECIAMLNEIEGKYSPEDLIKGFTVDQQNRIKKLAEEGLIPKRFGHNELVVHYLSTKAMKLYKTGNVKESQEAYDYGSKALGIPGNEDVSQMNAYKLWRDLEKADLTEAVQYLDKPIFLPSFVSEAMKENPEKLKLLKELNDSQMDALMEFCAWNKDREDCLDQYEETGDEWEMPDLEADYDEVVEKMNLLKVDIHKDFDFAIPDLQKKPSLMQELDEELTNKTPEFEAAFKKLRGDRSLAMELVIDAVKELKESKDQIALLETVEELKFGKVADLHLTELLLSAARRNDLDFNVKECLKYHDFNNSHDLVDILKALEWIRSCRTDSLILSKLDFWKQLVFLLQGLDDSAESANLKERLPALLEFRISPLNFEDLGSVMSSYNIGSKGTELMKQCVDCIKEQSTWNPKGLTAEYEYAQAYLNFFIEVNGLGMDVLDSMAYGPKYYKAADPQIVADFVHKKKKAYRKKKADFSAGPIIYIMNSDVIKKLQARRDALCKDDPPERKSISNLKEFIDKIYHVGDAPHFLEVCAHNMLLKFLDSNFICEWKPVPVTNQASLEDVTLSFEPFSQSTDKALEDDFVEKATAFLTLRQQQIMDEVNTPSS